MKAPGGFRRDRDAVMEGREKSLKAANRLGGCQPLFKATSFPSPTAFLLTLCNRAKKTQNEKTGTFCACCDAQGD